MSPAHSCGDINTGKIPAISDFSYNTKLVFRDWEDSKDLAGKSLDLMVLCLEDPNPYSPKEKLQP